MQYFINNIDDLKILKWKKKHAPDTFLMDGVNWTIKYDDSEHKTYKIEGENAYPEKWMEFMDLISEIVVQFWDYK